MMDWIMIRRLILKDWYFNRGIIAAYLAAGMLALALIAFGEKAVFYSGSILLVTVLIAVGIHMTIVTVVQERKEKTLPFIMSLPISSMEYTTAKILTNLLIFLLPWCALLIGTILVILSREYLQNGLIPYVSILLSEILVAWSLILAVAIITESEGWTIFAMVICNLFFNYFLYYLSNNPNMAEAMKEAAPVWSNYALGMLALEFTAILLILGVTFYLQKRKKDFL